MRRAREGGKRTGLTRIMDRQREAAWKSALAKMERGEEVPSEEHYALLREGLFEGMDKVTAQEEATYVVLYLLHETDLSPIPWRGSIEADNWFEMRETWGEERQAEKLRNMIEASERDPDYWEALNCIAARLHKERRLFPHDLADWASRLHKGEVLRPPKLQSNKGQPHYANNSRDLWLAHVFSVLQFLGLTSKMECREAIAVACGQSDRTVAKAIKAATESDGKLPAPWECWPPAT